jgi:hypothetical protein
VNRDSQVRIAMGYDITNKLRLIIKELNREILCNQPAMYEAVKALITETLLTESSLNTIQQKFIILQTCVPYEMLLLSLMSTESAVCS